uniref:Uncharacterized protein n=1 Tax=Anguilla anguilla TaxID=7936 RepID=A0A0E9PRA8_ANGAN
MCATVMHIMHTNCSFGGKNVPY